MRVEKFEDILIWQKSRELCLIIYRIFDKNKDYRFRDQIQSASVSIMNNVAEGYERMGNKEFRKFLYISKGSCGEVRSMLYLAKDLNYVSNEDFDRISTMVVEISKMLNGFIKKMII